MTQSKTPQFSGPFHRAQLLRLNQYVASTSFLGIGAWDRSRADDLYVVKGTVGRSAPAKIMLVGVISSDRTYLEPHGNWSSEYGDADKIGKTKLTFVVGRPSNDPDFSSDYDIVIKRLVDIQNEIAESKRHEHFILSGDRIKMNFPLFIKPNLHDDVQHITGEYKVDETYKDLWAKARNTYEVRLMPVYGVDENIIEDYRRFHNELQPGATVEVTFTLKHYAFVDRGTKEVQSDTFTAHVNMVYILKKAPQPSFSIIKVPTRRPTLQSLTPARSEQTAAALAFVPPPVKDSTSSISSTSSVGTCSTSPENFFQWSPTPPRNTEFVEGSSGSIKDASTNSPLAAIHHLLASSPSPETQDALFKNSAFVQMLPMILKHLNIPHPTTHGACPDHTVKTNAPAESILTEIDISNSDSSPNNNPTLPPIVSDDTHVDDPMLDNDHSGKVVESNPTNLSSPSESLPKSQPTQTAPQRGRTRFGSSSKNTASSISTTPVPTQIVAIDNVTTDAGVPEAIEMTETAKQERREQKKRKLT